MRGNVILIFTILSLFSFGIGNETKDMERSEIRARCLDYIEGWFDGDIERMRLCLHPDLAKRGVFTVSKTGRSNLGFHSKTTLIEGTRIGKGKKYPKNSRNIKIEILDIGEKIGTAKVSCLITTEYLHIVKYNGKWLIINVLYEMKR